MSLDNNKSSQKVLDSDGLKYLLQKMKNTHMSKLATDSELGHVKIGPTSTPSAVNGEGVVAPSYHTHPAQTEITGNAGTASKLKNAVNIALAGAVTGNADFDGSKNITINTTINKNSQAITGKTSLSGLEPGDYVESNGNKYTDSPNGSNSTNDFVISVIGSDNDKSQIFTDLVTGKVYIRVIEDGVASEWKEVLTVSNGTIDANATSADKLKTARNISISGDADGSALFDGSKDVDIDITLSDTGVDADTYGSNSQSNFNATREITIPSYTVDSDGRITASSDQTIKIPESSGGGTGGGISPVNIALAGDVTGSKIFDGTTDISIDTTLKNSGVSAGTYGQSTNVSLSDNGSFKIPKITVDAKGRVTSANNTTISIPSGFGDKVKSSPATTGKIYLSGKTDSTESTSNDSHSSELYYDTDSKTLNAPNISGNFTGNASTASKLAKAVDISLSGDTTGTASFDGSKSVNIETTLADSGANAGTYGQTDNTTVENGTSIKIPKIEVDTKGRITSATDTTATIPADAFDKVKTTTATSGNIYLSGKSTSNDDTGSELISPNLYYDVTNNTFHAGKIAATIEGVSDTANKLAVARDIALAGDVTGTTSFDGSKNVSMNTTLKNSGVTAGTYGNEKDVAMGTGDGIIIPKITVNAKGIVTSATTTSASLSADSLNKVKSSPATTGKIYLSGKNDSVESTSTDVHNSNLYYDTETKTLVAPNISGKASGAASADKLSSAVNIALTGDATGSTSFDGSKSVSIATTLANSGVTAGTYGLASSLSLSDDTSFNVPQFTVDAKGRVTSAKHSTVTIPASILNRVKTTTATSGVIYISGKTTSDDNIGQEFISPNLYYDVTNNTFHAGKINATIEGVSDTANKLAVARNISLAGDVTGSTSFDGSKDVSISATLKNSGVTADTYGNTSNITLGANTSVIIPKITINAKGIVTSATTTTATISADSLNKVKSSPITTGKIYLSGKSDSTESTSTDVHNSGLYYDTETKTLVAPNISGKTSNASSADKLSSAVNITLNGDTSGSTSFDGSKSVSIATTLANSGVTAGKYGPVLSTTLGTGNTINIPYITVDAKGRITAAKNSPLTIPDNAFNTVKTDIADSGYIFISGKSELVSGNGTEVINSDLYYDVTNKILHAGKIAGTIEGVSDSANRLAKAVNINLVGAVTGSQAFDGSTSINITTTIETITNEEIDAMMDS